MGKQGGKQAVAPVVGGKKADEIIGITVPGTGELLAVVARGGAKAEMIEYYTEISGFFIMRPATMHIWNTIRKWFQERSRPWASRRPASPCSCRKSRWRRRRTTSRARSRA